MRFLSRLFALSHARNDVSRKGASPKARVAGFESLERRELLALSATSADFQALLKDSSTIDSDDAAIWVSSLNDTSSAKDGKITLREALDYAGQTVDGKTIASTIRFKVGGTIQLSSSLQSLKVLSKSVSIDASDVGGVTIQAAKNSLALYVFGGTVASRVSVSISDATIIGGVATAETASSPSKGGAIQISSCCDVTLERCDVRNAYSASVLGGGVYVGGGSLTLIDSSVSQNVGSGDACQGGAVYVESGELNATRAKFVGNGAASGGALYVKSGSVQLDSCCFDSNVSQTDGGAIYVNSGSLSLTNVGFTRNESAENGGALFAEGDANCALEEVQFVENEAVAGGALYFSGEYLSVEKSSFSNNSSSKQGGAIYVDANSSLDVEDSSFVENDALIGGAVYNSGQAIISNVRFESNEAKDSGGAFYTQGYLEARDSVFDASKAGNFGGAIYVDDDAQVWLLRSDVENSEATEGAGLYNVGSTKIVDSTLSANVATNIGGAVSNSGDLYVAGSLISDNEAQSEFGAGAGFLNYYDATITLVDSTITGNSTEGSGGALANNGTATLVGDFIASNAAGSGGAIYTGGDVAVYNSTLCDNRATNGGACYGAYGSATNLEGVSLRNNRATNNGGALYSYGAASLKNTTVVGNAAIKADVAAYYASSNASGSVYVDATSTVKDNVALSALDPENVNKNVVITDLATLETVDETRLFGTFAATSGSNSKSFAITNNGDAQLNFSDFQSSGDSAFSYALTTTGGAALDYETFALAPNETVLLTVTFKAQKVGSKFNELQWTVRESTEDGEIDDAQTTAKLTLTALTSKAASVTTKITSTSEESDATIAFDADGSFTVALSKEPTENVVVYLDASEGLTLSTDVLLFTPENYNVPQTVTASLDVEALRDGDLETKFTVSPTIITSDSTWNVVSVPKITLQTNEYIALRGENAIDLNEYVAGGASRWDLDDDGNVDATTNGDPCVVPASAFTNDAAVYYQTKSGETTSHTLDVIALDDLPSASAELACVAGTNGVVRLKLATEADVAARWRVDWGDGSPYSTFESLSTSALFGHCYAEDGRYVVAVELLDAAGQSSGWNVVGEAEISGVSDVQTAFAQVDDLLETQEIKESLATVAASVAQVEVVDVFATLKETKNK